MTSKSAEEIEQLETKFNTYCLHANRINLVQDERWREDQGLLLLFVHRWLLIFYATLYLYLNQQPSFQRG